MRLKGVAAARRNRVNPPCFDHVSQPRFAGLRAKPQSDLLAQRGRRAHHRRGRVVELADRVQVVDQRIVGERLDDQPRPVGSERLAHVARRTHRITHVVQAVEGRHQVVVGAGIVLGGCHLEPDGVRNPSLARRFGGARNRGVVVVEADETGVGEGLAP